MPVIRIYNPLVLQSPRSSSYRNHSYTYYYYFPIILYLYFSSWAVAVDLLAPVLAVPRPARVATSVTARDAEYVISPMIFQAQRLTQHV